MPVYQAAVSFDFIDESVFGQVWPLQHENIHYIYTYDCHTGSHLFIFLEIVFFYICSIQCAVRRRAPHLEHRGTCCRNRCEPLHI